MKNYKIRKAVHEDGEGIFKLWRELALDHYKKQNVLDPKIDASNNYYGKISCDEIFLYVAEVKGEIVAFIEAYIEPFENGLKADKCIYILHCYVKENYRKTMILNDLLQEVEKKAFENSINIITADIFYSNSDIYKNMYVINFKPFKTRFLKII